MGTLFENVDSYIDFVIKPFLPNARLGMTSCINNMTNASLKLYEMGQFKGSIFEKPFAEDLEFLHFTSISNLYSILKTQTLRMSDLNCMKDDKEYSFAGLNLVDNFIEDRFKELKSSIFSISLCDFSPSILLDKNIWSDYGRERKGACIKLKLHKARGLPPNYYLNKIIYHPEKPISELKQIKERHNVFKSNNGWGIENLDECLIILCSFYKRIQYQKEKETRLIKYIRKEADNTHYEDHSKIGITFSEDTEKINYQYDLLINSTDTINPMITIEQIFIGDKINEHISYLKLKPILEKHTNEKIPINFLNFND